MERSSATPIIEANRITAVERLDRYLQRPEETILREHQIDVMDSLRGFYDSGETAGYINLPTGSGKGVIISEIAVALGLKTVILSPTLKILEQTGEDAKKNNPSADISNRYSGTRDVSGQIINTTYQSLEGLIRSGELTPDEIGLVISDEAHMALGEKRHKVFRNFPNAILLGLTATPHFTPIEGYKKRGIVDSDERWVGLFENSIHDMSLEEAIERGILVNLDVNIIRSGVRVGDVRVSSGGTYDEKALDRQLNIQARNNIALAMLGGLNDLPDQIVIPDKLKPEINRIHEQIKGKKTAIFGISIDHVTELAKLIESSGRKVGVVHHKIDHKERNKVFEKYESGEIDVILGVDMLRLGWDSPSTEVGIYLAPTRSGVVATQELGRILRTSPGKEKAIAIQMIDLFEKRGQSPVLIPNIFDPYFVLRGSTTGEAREGFQNRKDSIKDLPNITFSGEDIEAIVEQARSQEILRRKLSKASLQELDEVTSNLAFEIYQENPEASPVDIYRRISEEIPFHISNEVFQKITESLSSIDSNTVKMGKRVLVHLYMNTILSAAENFFTGDKDIDSDIVQSAILNLYENAEKLIKKGTSPSTRINGIIKSSVYRQIAEVEGVPPSWIRNKSFQNIKSRAFDAISSPSSKSLDEYALDIAKETGENPEQILIYIKYLLELKSIGNDVSDQNQELESIAIKTATKEALIQILDSLSAKEREVIELRFGLKGRQPKTQKEIGEIFGVTGNRISQIERKALRRLRHPARARKIEDLFSGSEGSGVIQDGEPEITRYERERGLEKRRAMIDQSMASLGLLGPESRQRVIEDKLDRKPLENRVWSYILDPEIPTGITLVGLSYEKDLKNIPGLRMLISEYLKNVDIGRMRIISQESSSVGFPDIKDLVNSRDLPNKNPGIFFTDGVGQYLESGLDRKVRSLKSLIDAARIEGKAPIVFVDRKTALEVLPKEIRSQIQ